MSRKHPTPYLLMLFPLTEKSLDPYSPLAQKGIFIPQSIQSPHKSIG